MSAPAGFCLSCRALLDADQGCECGAEGRPIELDADAASRIEPALMVTPVVDRADLTNRAIVGGVVVLGPVGIVFVVAYAAVLGTLPELAEQWPWFLGLPYALLAAAWSGFLTWSALEERKPYCAATLHRRPRPEHVEEAQVETGTLIACEIHQRFDAKQIVVRDARIEEALVLRRSGEQILVPAGRVDASMPPERWRPGSAPLVREWTLLPAVVFGAGVVRRAELRRGDRVLLFGGRLEPLEPDEKGFRAAAEQRWRWIPDGGRTRLAVGFTSLL